MLDAQQYENILQQLSKPSISELTEQIKNIINSDDFNAKAMVAVSLLSLQNKHIEISTYSIYIQYSRLIIDNVSQNIDKLSDLGLFFYSDAIERLLEVKKRYKW